MKMLISKAIRGPSITVYEHDDLSPAVLIGFTKSEKVVHQAECVNTVNHLVA